MASDDAAARLRALFDFQLDMGLHHGAQLAVYRDGEQVVDFAGGTTGPDGGETTSDRRHVLWSATKPLAGTCLHQLVERGELDYDDPVREHWPGFADPGTTKAGITVRHVMSHQAGLPEAPIDGDPSRWGDWDAVVASMEDADPAFEPGTTAAYHALTYGWLVGELVRRASGRPIDEYARDNVFEPLGMDDTSIGLPEGDEDDVATITGFAEFDRCRAPSMGLEGLSSEDGAALGNLEEFRRAVAPAANGLGTASDLARFYACLANGGELDGTRVLGADTVDRATSVEVEVEEDGTLGTPIRYGLGFMRAWRPYSRCGSAPPGRVFYHPGLRSVIGWGDPETDLAAAYVTNGIRSDYEDAARQNAVADAVRAVFR